MVKLLRTGTSLEYAEMWYDEDEKGATTHEGIVGEVGLVEKFAIATNEEYQKLLDGYITLKAGEGYQGLDELNLFQVAVQFAVDDWGTEEELDKRNEIGDLLDQCLGWTGNGRWEGADMGSGMATNYCLVVDVHKAVTTILSFLQEKSFLDGAVIAYLPLAQMAEDDTVEPVILFPEGGRFEW